MRSHSNNTLHEILSKHAARIFFVCYFRLRVDALDRAEPVADAPLGKRFGEEDFAVRLVWELRAEDVFA
jgi:hypothetical protein